METYKITEQIPNVQLQKFRSFHINFDQQNIVENLHKDTEKIYIFASYTHDIVRWPENLRILEMKNIREINFSKELLQLQELNLSIYSNYDWIKNLTKLEKLTIYIDSNFNFDIIPKSVKYLSVSFGMSNVKEFEMLPESIEELKISCYDANGIKINKNVKRCHLDGKIKNTILHNDIEELTLEGRTIIDKFPDNLRKLVIKRDFIDENLDMLPENLEVLELVNFSFFNENIDNLPDNLRVLKFSGFSLANDPHDYFEHSNFNKPIDHLPMNLQELYLIDLDEFNSSLDNLPEGLRILELSGLSDFDQNLDYLPESLQVLKLIKLTSFNRPLDNLPDNLETLICSELYEFSYTLDFLPKGLTKLDIVYLNIDRLNNLPRNLKEIKISVENEIDINNLPMVKKCVLGFGIYSFDNLPCSITNLKIHITQDDTLDNLPTSVKKMVLVFGYMADTIKSLPHGVEELVLVNCRQIIGTDVVIGENVKVLKLIRCDVRVCGRLKNVKKIILIGSKFVDEFKDWDDIDIITQHVQNF